jgi:hypothetical protein
VCLYAWDEIRDAITVINGTATCEEHMVYLKGDVLNRAVRRVRSRKAAS